MSVAVIYVTNFMAVSYMPMILLFYRHHFDDLQER